MTSRHSACRPSNRVAPPSSVTARSSCAMTSRFRNRSSPNATHNPGGAALGSAARKSKACSVAAIRIKLKRAPALSFCSPDAGKRNAGCRGYLDRVGEQGVRQAGFMEHKLDYAAAGSDSRLSLRSRSFAERNQPPRVSVRFSWEPVRSQIVRGPRASRPRVFRNPLRAGRPRTPSRRHWANAQRLIFSQPRSVTQSPNTPWSERSTGHGVSGDCPTIFSQPRSERRPYGCKNNLVRWASDPVDSRSKSLLWRCCQTSRNVNSTGIRQVSRSDRNRRARRPIVREKYPTLWKTNNGHFEPAAV